MKKRKSYLILLNQGVNQLHKYLIVDEACLPVSVNLPVIIANQLLNELAILVQHFISHVGDVMEDSFIFNLEGKVTITILTRRSCVKDFAALGITAQGNRQK